jgi:hypothetical protein
MDEEHKNRRRLKVAGIAAAAVLAVPGGMAISNAVAADDGTGSSSSSQVVPVQSEGYTQPDREAPQAERGQAPGDRGDCPPGEGGGESGGSGSGAGNDSTGYTLQ